MRVLQVVRRNTGTILVLLLALAIGFGCGSVSNLGAASPPILTATATIPSGTQVPAGGCFATTASVPGATTGMAVLVSPGGSVQGLSFPLVFEGHVDATDHVAIEVCKIASGAATAGADVSLNVRVVP